MEIVELEQYYDIVKRLMRLGREGGYWDFKREYPSNKAELLLDIICMANNQEDREAYLIYGIQDRSWQVIGVENDKNRLKLNQLSQFLSGKHFAVYIPQIDLQTIVLENHEIDILIVHDTKHTPYYLEKDFVDDDKKVIHGVIYSRLNDRKTGTSEATPYTCVEHLWKKRFGIDMSIMQRLHMRLEEYDKWQFDWGNKKYAYHIDFPEFRIEIEGDFKEGWIPSAAFYTHPVFYYANLNIYYHNTVIYESGLWSFDEFRRYLPAAKNYAVKFKMDYWYTYYDLSEIEGKLLKIFTSGKCNISSREANRSQILIFKNERDKCEFDRYLHEHFSDYTDEYIMDEYKYQIEEENKNEFGGGIYSAFQVAKTAKIYDKWCNETGRKYYENWI
ncbi:MAG: ATP-binding protein [Lachnospiraceae bacterium]|nr:ATP-binding protein [Lachnospiraceae bacterium]